MTSDEQAVRAELLEAVTELCRRAPHYRLGQILCILATVAGRLGVSGVWDLEDDEALESARFLVDRAREQSARREEALAELRKMMPG